MRKRNQKQMPLTPRTVDHPHSMELELISRILDHIPPINEVAWQDLTQHVANVGTGTDGMSAEQVVRCAIVKQMEDYSYDELAFHYATHPTGVSQFACFPSKRVVWLP
jgi:IS5 family transposase